jgi:hypothetical protein
MTERPSPAPMLYRPDTDRWLSTLAAAIDQAAAGFCWQQWLRRLVPRLLPVGIGCVPRTNRPLD